METEIKFRGRDLNNNGEWRTGSLIIYPKGNHVIIDFDDQGNELSWDVDPGTIGQLVKIVDGKELYHGDIVGFTYVTDIPLVGSVVADIEAGTYIDRRGIAFAIEKVTLTSGVLGNIYENIKLLKKYDND